MVDFLRPPCVAVCQAKGPEGRKNLDQGAQPGVQGAPVGRQRARRPRSQEPQRGGRRLWMRARFCRPLRGLRTKGDFACPRLPHLDAIDSVNALLYVLRVLLQVSFKRSSSRPGESPVSVQWHSLRPTIPGLVMACEHSDVNMRGRMIIRMHEDLQPVRFRKGTEN